MTKTDGLIQRLTKTAAPKLPEPNKTGGPPQRLTEKAALALPEPEAGYVLTWCPVTKGFGVRVTSAGTRAWVSERRVNGKTVRRTLGKVTGRSAISAAAARHLMLDVSSELQNGVDRLGEQRAERAARKVESEADALTLEKALHQYLKGKRRGKDGLALKERTKADYLAMIAPGRVSKPDEDGKCKAFADGELFTLADKPLTKITAADIRGVYVAAASRGPRRQVYAMQVLRAVLRWHGVTVPGNPLAVTTAGRDRIVLKPTAGTPNPIPPEKLRAWWAAATKIADRDGEGTRGRVAADLYRFALLTGARGGEVKALTVADVDVTGGRAVLRDTKNRRDHTLVLSRQAQAIAAKHADGKEPDDVLFPVGDPRKTLALINEAAEVTISGHDLRATFATVAAELVSAFALRRMLNHTDMADVAGTHYVSQSEAQLRAGWQAVADFIAGPVPTVEARGAAGAGLGDEYQGPDRRSRCTHATADHADLSRPRG